MLSWVSVEEGIISHGAGVLMACSRNTSHTKLPIHHSKQTSVRGDEEDSGLDLYEVVGVKDITKPLPLVTHSAKCIHACMESTLQVIHVSRWEKEVIFSEGGCMSSMSIVFWYPVHGNRSAGVYPSCCRLRGRIHPGQETVAYQAQRDRQLWFLQGHDNSWWNQFRLTVFWPLSDTKLCHRAFCLHTLTQRQHHYFNSSVV